MKTLYVSIYTGRGCRSKCTFCLWPQTVGGHRYRTRSVENVLAEVKWTRDNMPEVKEIMFDDDTFKKGLRTDIARRFSEDCRKLDIKIHGTFILGLPGETQETIEKTIEYAKEINPHTIQVSLAAPYPGTRLYDQAVENGWLQENKVINLVNKEGVQLAAIGYPHLSREEIYHHVESFYKRFYFRPSKIWEIVREMLMSWDMMMRRLREGVEFFRFLRAHEA